MSSCSRLRSDSCICHFTCSHCGRRSPCRNSWLHRRYLLPAWHRNCPPTTLTIPVPAKHVTVDKEQTKKSSKTQITLKPPLSYSGRLLLPETQVEAKGTARRSGTKGTWSDLLSTLDSSPVVQLRKWTLCWGQGQQGRVAGRRESWSHRSSLSVELTQTAHSSDSRCQHRGKGPSQTPPLPGKPSMWHRWDRLGKTAILGDEDWAGG